METEGMGTEGLVSVVMPAYNAENTVGQAIRSVIRQTYPDWEMIVIDDGSTDGTLRVVEGYSAGEARIRVISNRKNMGVSAARNLGVKNARGEWIAFLDSDDLWAEDKLERQMKLVHDKTRRGEPADIVYTGSAFIGSDGRPSSYRLRVQESISYHELLKQNVISCSSVLVRKELLLKYPMEQDDMHEDYAVWLQILRDGGTAYGIDDPLLIYRLSESSRSGNKKKAAVMTYRVYRFMGLNRFQSLYHLCWYAYRNLRKYRAISRGLSGRLSAGSGPKSGYDQRRRPG